MLNFMTRLFVAMSLVFVVGCGGGGGPMGKMIGHRKAMIAIVEANKTDAAKAADGLEQYLKDNDADLKALGAEMDKLKAEQGDDKTKMLDMLKDYGSDMADLMQREQALRKDAPDVWKDERVRTAMRALKGLR